MSDPAAEATPSGENQTTPDLDPEVEQQLREAAEAEDLLAKDIQEKCQSEFDKRSSMISEEFDVHFKSQMSKVADRYTSHTHDHVTNRQTDVLRINKIFREVSRELGADWKPVFQKLTKEQDEQKVRVEMARIERLKPIIQPYKALNVWKELMGETFDIRPLVECLVSIDRRDLAEKALDILDNNEIDSLYSTESVGRGVAGGAPKQQTSQAGEGVAENGKKTPLKAAPFSDPLADGALLKIAKAIGSDWLPLAKALELPDEEIEETKQVNGDSYHGGFKSLFSWRDSQVEKGQLTAESATALSEILTKLGKADLAATLTSSS